MRVYFFGDIHGNAYALERCLSHLKEVKADRVYCLGDIVGWLPFGDRSYERMRQLDIPTVAGNHDLLVAGLFKDSPTQLDRMQASAYNAGLLSTIPGAIDYLLGLPLCLEEDEFMVVHHSPFLLPQKGRKPNIECFPYLTEDSLKECIEEWRQYPKRIIFSGHDHLPAIFELPRKSAGLGLQDINVYRPRENADLTLRLKPESKYWVKAGSVGGPYRDGVPVCNTCLYDSEEQAITLFRLRYPTVQLQKDLASNGFCMNLETLKSYLENLEQAAL